jgi:Na+-transporting NADH:ubiquinone oxidoreductase subunit NqrC
LGAEITKPQFKNQFDGKRLAEGDVPMELKPAGTELDVNEVHAVTGATQTCTRLEGIINSALVEWRKEMEKN